MPFGDGTGPLGQGPRTGGGQGGGMGRGFGRRRGPSGQAGPGGFCVCPGCGERVVHQRGTPCASMSCVKCGAPMVRE